MSGGFGSRLSSAGLMAGVVIAMMAGSSGVAAATEDLGGCTYYAPGEAGGPTKCPNWATEHMNLSGRDFTNADLHNAKFLLADLRGTNFTNANLRGVVASVPTMDAATQLRGAIVDNKTYLGGLVGQQEVYATSVVGDKSYFIVDGAHPGLPSRFRPPAIPRGVSIDACRSDDPVRVRASVNGQPADVEVLSPGRYVLTCTFFTADRPNDKGTTSISVKVNKNPRPAGAGPANTE